MRRLIPIALAVAATLAIAGGTAAAPATEAVYADGQVYEMLGVTSFTTSSPGLLSAPPLYLIGYPTSQASGPLVLPSGNQPQCDPCDHSPFHYHDHVLTGEPGSGTNGTAGDYQGPWRIVVMAYSPRYYMSPGFVPITSDQQIPAYEQDGRLLPLNPGAENPYQIWTNMILICPVIRSNG